MPTSLRLPRLALALSSLLFLLTITITIQATPLPPLASAQQQQQALFAPVSASEARPAGTLQAQQLAEAVAPSQPGLPRPVAPEAEVVGLADPAAPGPVDAWAKAVGPGYYNYREARESSVGVVFTSTSRGGGEDSVLFWLPLGERVWNRDVPDLPLRPTAARITTMIHSTPALASPEVLERVVCRVHVRSMGSENLAAKTRRVRSLGAGEQTLAFSRVDELVRLVDAGSGSWIGARSVEDELQDTRSKSERVRAGGEVEWVECS